MFISVVVVVAVVVILFMNVGCTGMFTNSPPKGDQAMGLVVPIFALPIAAIALTLAALLGAGWASMSAMGAVAAWASSPALSGAIAVAMTFGAALASGMAFMLWCEPAAVSKRLAVMTAPFGILTGICGPVVLGAMLLVGVWMPRETAAEALASGHASGVGLKAGFFAVFALSVVGYSLGGIMLSNWLRHRAASQAARVAEILEREAKWEAKRQRPPKQRITEEFAEFSPETPLWYVLTYFLDQPPQRMDDECRGIVVRRALQVPDFDAQLERCMASPYRVVATEFLVHVPDADLAARQDAWGRALLAGVQATGAEMAGTPGWLAAPSDLNPDPLGHVRSVLKAAGRFQSWSEYGTARQRLQSLADGAGALNADAAREQFVTMLGDAGYRASR